MIDIGRICVKIAGRDAGKKCVIIDTVDKNTVLIDGETRRRKCNIAHLELLEQTVKVSKGASHDAVAAALGITARKPKVRAKPKVEQQKKTVAAKPAVAKPVKKAAVKKTA